MILPTWQDMVRNVANVLLAQHVDGLSDTSARRHWVANFINLKPHLQPHRSRRYDYERALFTRDVLPIQINSSLGAFHIYISATPRAPGDKTVDTLPPRRHHHHHFLVIIFKNARNHQNTCVWHGDEDQSRLEH